MQQPIEKTTVTILYTSDVHGNVLPLRYADNMSVERGLAKIASLVKLERETSRDVLLIDNGDVIQGTPLTYHHARVTPDLPNPLTNILNHVQYDAAVVGNHEFNYGPEILNRVVRDSSFPWLSANTVRAGTREPFFGTPYLVKTLPSGVRVGVLGLTTHYIPNWENPSHIAGLEFLDAVETCQKWVQWIRTHESVDLLTVAYHGGFERDPETGEPTEMLTGENQGYRMCMEVPGIDVLLTGHQHRLIPGTLLNGVLVIQPGSQGEFLGRVQVSMERKDGSWATAEKVGDLLSVEGAPADQAIVSSVQPYEEQVQVWLDQPVGHILGDMTVVDPLSIRLKDNPLIEFINRVQMDAAGVQISNTALFDNTCPGFPTDVTMRDIVANYIYPNTLKVLRITGRDIKQALERTASYFELYEGDGVQVSKQFSTPKPQHYNYDMWEGIRYKINISRPVGERVTVLTLDGRPLDPDGEYDVVMNNYRAAGGGEYTMFKDKPVIKEILTEVPELIVNYILEKKVIPATVDDNWEVTWDIRDSDRER